MTTASKPKMYDALDRRLRWARPHSTGVRIVPQEADYQILEALDCHGPLPATYLYEFVKPLRSNYTGHQKRLCQLYNEANTPHGGPYLTRPRQQAAAFNARYQPLTYDISRSGRLALAERGTLQRYVAPRTDPMKHRFMTACATASIRLAAERAGLDYVPLEQIICHEACPSTTRAMNNPLLIRILGRQLIPDDLFGLGYPTEPRAFRFFALEVDRGTESLGRSDVSQTAYGAKLPLYVEAARRQAYVDRWGVPNLLVLTLTTSPTRMNNMMECLANLTDRQPKLRERFLFAFEQSLVGPWNVPSVRSGLLATPWKRSRCAPLQIDSS